MSTGTLHLIPVGLGPAEPAQTHPATLLATLHSLDYFIVERAKSARAELKRLGHPRPIQTLEIIELPEKIDNSVLDELLVPIRAGRNGGVMSEAGCPAVADPGAQVARRAHALGIRVQPHVGPSALLLALMASGLNGQCFRFHGYLPADATGRSEALKKLERESTERKQTQLFIETPYRNAALYESLLRDCRGDTLLTLACNLTLADEFIRTATIAEWKKATPPELQRRPCVFLILAN